jgi:flagellar M-ring protein FliF
MMAELKKGTDQLSTIYKGLTLKAKLFILIATLLTLGSLIGLIMWASRPEYRTLYTGLSSEDAGAVVSSLSERRIPYKVGADGSTIMVPANLVYELRMQMASKGLPQSSVIGYEIFDRQGIGVTEFVQRVNLQRALQGELSRTISQFAEVKSCRIYLAIPKKALFLEEQEEARASVVLTLYAGKALDESQIQGIRHLVACSVEGMVSDNVIVVDSHGKLLAGEEEKAKYAGLTLSQQKIQAGMETNLERKIESMLVYVVGPNKVTAKVSLDMDFTQVEQTEESYDPETAAVRSEQRTSEKSSGKRPVSSGIPGVMSNTPDLDQAGGAAAAARSAEYSKSDETINYEISRVTKRIVNQVGTIDRLTAAVLIDGTYVTEKDKDGNEVRKYVPRSDEEMKKYEALVKRAVGYNEDREDSVEVVNIQFREMPLPEEETAMERVMQQIDWRSIVVYVTIAILFALFFIFGLRPLMGMISKTMEWAKAYTALAERRRGREPEGPEEELLPGLDKARQFGEKQSQLLNFAKKNPKLFAQYLKSYLE